jgi:hypothetical protein
MREYPSRSVHDVLNAVEQPRNKECKCNERSMPRPTKAVWSQNEVKKDYFTGDAWEPIKDGRRKRIKPGRWVVHDQDVQTKEEHSR